MSVCRICLISDPKRDLSVVHEFKNGEKHSLHTMIVFCLGIDTTEDSSNEKLCLQCFEKILIFYEFKSLALKNNIFFQSDSFMTSEIYSSEKQNWFLKDIIDQPTIEDGSEDEDQKELKNDSERKVQCQNKIINLEESSDESLGALIIDEDYNEDAQATPAPQVAPAPLPVPATLTSKETCPTVRYEDSPRFTCLTCGVRLSDRVKLYKHRTKHIELTPYKCRKCNTRFINETRYLKHIQICNHKGKRTCYFCDHCPKSYLSKQSLRVHLTLHTNEKPFPCPECGKAWRSAPLLKAHLATHVSDKSFKCSVCDKGFRTRSYLVKHVKIHMNDRKYRCEYCAATFIRIDAMKRHELSVHLQQAAAAATDILCLEQNT